MGNRAKRVKISKRLKELKLGKLYYGNKKVAWRLLTNWRIRDLQKILQLNVGDLVQDCDGFNHIIKEFDLCIATDNNWFDKKLTTIVTDIDQIKFTDNTLSCGCKDSLSKPLSRDIIEKNTFEWLQDPKNRCWLTSKDYKMLTALQKGEHICDDRGLLLQEYLKNS